VGRIREQRGASLDTIVIDANLFISPQFNMQVRHPQNLPLCTKSFRVVYTLCLEIQLVEIHDSFARAVVSKVPFSLNSLL
jgi:hypothetical protein